MSPSQGSDLPNLPAWNHNERTFFTAAQRHTPFKPPSSERLADITQAG